MIMFKIDIMMMFYKIDFIICIKYIGKKYHYGVVLNWHDVL